MADNNSKKYLSGDNLKYTLQQLKTKLDELYVSESEIFDTVSNEVAIPASDIQEQFNIFDGALNLVPGEIYTLVYNGKEYTDDCSANGVLSFEDLSNGLSMSIWDKHELNYLEDEDDYECVKTGADKFVITQMMTAADIVLKCGSKKIVKPALLSDMATKEYVDENKFSGDYNDLENKPVSIINFNTDFVDAVATHSEAYKVDTIAFSQSITVDDSHEYFVEAKYTDGAVVTKPLELAETSYRMYSKINAKAVVGSFDENVIDTNNQIGYVTSLIPIKYYNNKISICKKSNQSWYDFNLLVVDENLTITNIYTHDNLPTVDSLPSTAAYFAIYKYYTSSITDVDYLFSGDVTDGGLFIRIDSDIKYAGVCIFLEHSEEGNSILSNTEYTICEATSNYVLQNSDLGLYIADSMDVIYPAAYSETFVANDTGFASAMLIMNYSNISSIRVYTKNILVNAENKALATKEYVDTAVTIDEDELDDMLADIYGTTAQRGSVSIINNTWSGKEPIESMTNNNTYIEYGKPYTNTIKFTADYYFISYRFTNYEEEYLLRQDSNNEISIEIAQIDKNLGDLIIEILEYE